MSEMEAFVGEFVVESRENLDQLERDLIELESDPCSSGTLASIFRTVHTIKGAAGFMGLSRLQTLAHSGESVLSRLREGSLKIDPAIASQLLAMADCMRRMLSRVEHTGDEGETDVAAIVERLAGVQHSDASPAIAFADSRSDQGENMRAVQPTSNVRVNVEHLDKLMNLVGELVLARNEIVQFTAGERNAVLLGTSQRLNAITTQLQEGIMKTRMQPIDTVWSKLPRVVRDGAQCCGKRVRLEMEGQDTELDRTLLEAIQDPLTHVVRNSIDHGLEAPEDRIAAGKTAEGRLVLRACHEGGQVTIEVSDDGAGIDVAAIRRRAQERGLVSAKQARGMSDQEATNLIFLPGFSTVTTVTNMSGRGVGMDVVKTNIEQIGGKVSIHSQAGAGTTVRMRIPLTLAIMNALVVTDGDNRYAIPQINVLELVRLDADDAQHGIEMIGDVAVYRLRGALLPLVWLDTELTPGRPVRPAGRPGQLARDSAADIVVLQADDLTFGLIVGEVNDVQEIVVKPLGRHVRGISIFAGATITGNGRIVLILDVPGLAVQANVLSEVRDTRALPSNQALDPSAEATESLLLLAGPDESRMAIPLSQITRLEEFSRSSVERVGGREAVQYVGDVLPLADMAALLTGCRTPVPASRTGNAGTLHALIYAHEGRQVGIVVDEILDTVKENICHLRPTTRHGVTGSVVVDGRVTDVLNLDTLCATLMSASASDGPIGAEV